MGFEGPLNAILSGACASTGVIAKLGLDDHLDSFIGKSLSFVLVVLLNIAMMTLFARGLAQCSSAVEPALLNTAANLVLTGVFGSIVFSESLDALWILGSLLILVGGYMVISENKSQENKLD